MKLTSKKIVFILSVIIITLLISSCKNVAKLEMDEIWGRAVKVIGTNKTNFSTFARISNLTPGIEARIGDWGFKIFSGDTLLFDVNSNNYNDFNFTVTVTKPVNFMSGAIVVMVGVPFYDAYISYVDQDIFQGKTPDKLVFEGTVIDMDGHVTELTSSNTLEYIEKEE